MERFTQTNFDVLLYPGFLLFGIGAEEGADCSLEETAKIGFRDSRMFCMFPVPRENRYGLDALCGQPRHE